MKFVGKNHGSKIDIIIAILIAYYCDERACMILTNKYSSQLLK